MIKYNQFVRALILTQGWRNPSVDGMGKTGLSRAAILGIYRLFIEITPKTFVTMIAGSFFDAKLFDNRVQCRTFLFFLSSKLLAYTWPEKQSVCSKSCASTPRIISWHFANVQELTFLWARASKRRPDRYDMSLT